MKKVLEINKDLQEKHFNDNTVKDSAVRVAPVVDGIWTYKVVHKKLVRKNAIKSKPKLRSLLPAVGKKRKRESGQQKLAMHDVLKTHT
jgi:hypothetical protein